MVGGATPPDDGSALILSLRRMNRHPVDQRGSRARGGRSGHDPRQLSTHAAERSGLRFPLTLGARGSCTIGGLVSTNAGGTQVLRFGTMRALVAGVEAVLPDGSVHDGLGGLKKDNRGYSLDQLLIGSEGTLGVITAAACGWCRRSPAGRWPGLGLGDPQAALDVLRMLEARSDARRRVRDRPGDSLALVLRHIPGTRAPLGGEHDWHVLIEATGVERRDERAGRTARALARRRAGRAG